MKNFVLALPLVLALAACGSEPEAPPAAAPTATPEPQASLPAPDQELFTNVFADSCDGAEPVNTAVCKRAMGSETVTCEYGLGEDEYLRHSADLTASEDGTEWVLAQPEAICAEHGATHHVDS